MRIQNRTKISLLFMLLLLPLTAWTAGGGGGGGGSSVPPPPPCDADTWECTSWASCQLDSTQARVCVLTFDCPTDIRPKPPTIQNCTPSCVEDLYSCTNWGPCDANGKQQRTCGKTADCPLVETAEPVETQACESSAQEKKPAPEPPPSSPAPQAPTKPQKTEPCKQDKYECDDWTQCNQNGLETRICKMTVNCPNISTTKPEETRVCPGLRCGHLPKLDERISCRLRLTDEELAKEFKILYAPEACKSIKDQEEKLECIRLYQEFGPCWQISVGNARNACAKKTIGLDNIKQKKLECIKLKNNERKQCLDELKEKVQYMIVFRMYDLEVRAETLLLRDLVTYEAVTNLETFIETKKAEMYATLDTTQWKKIIQKVQERWREFIKTAKPLLR